MEVILVLIGILILYIILEFNKFIRLKNKLKQSKSTIEVFLNKRFDLIPNLVECVKGYAKHEEQIFEEIARLRGEYNQEKVKSMKKGSKLNSECNRLLAIGENYPNLKASEQFLELERTLVKIENELQAARRVYNGDVTLYNTTISTFPDNIFAALFNLREEELFEIEEYKKENVKINL